MEKAWRILVNLYAVAQQLAPIGLRHHVHQLLVRNSRHNDAHIHAAFCRIDQRSRHLRSDDQIRRKNIHVFLCMRDQIQIDVLSDIFMIKW